MIEIDGVSVPFLPVGGVSELKKATHRSELNETSTFNQIFKDELNKLKFSAHALSRLNSRGVKLTENDVSRLNDAVEKANSKGSNETLVLIDEKAFIVSIPNRTVITVVNKNQMESNVITNIDSAVIA